MLPVVLQLLPRRLKPEPIIEHYFQSTRVLLRALTLAECIHCRSDS